MDWDELIKNGDNQAAIPLIQAKLVEDQSDDLRRLLAYCLVRTKNYEEALAALKSLTAITLEDWGLLTLIYENLSEWREMASALKRLAQVAPNARVYYGLAVAEMAGLPAYKLVAAMAASISIPRGL